MKERRSGSSGVVRVVALVDGVVQGVGYRWFARQRAEAAGLSGTVRNLPDGRVEVVLEGPEDAVRATVGALSGPDAPGAVRDVQQRDEPARGVRGFTTE